MPTGLVNGACGGANGVSYPYGSTGYGGNAQCSAGNSTNTAFPAPGSTVTWNCTGLNGGATSPQCSASQAPQPGALAIDMWWTPASIASGGYSTIQSNIDFLASN